MSSALAQGIDYPRAVRVDPETGAREEIEFLAMERGRMFVCTHLPRDPARAGVVICSPLFAEFLKNYRREVLLARTLAGRGFAVRRFHYIGTGHSADGKADLTLDGLRADAGAAVDELLNRIDTSRLFLMGTRLGAVVAAIVASHHPETPLALWEPASDADGYFHEAARARLMQQLKEGTDRVPRRARLPEQLERSGEIDVLGYPITRALIDSVTKHHLHDIPLGSRTILLIQLARNDQLRPAYTDLAERWSHAGAEVATLAIREEQSWWFAGETWEPDEERPGTEAAINATADWMRKALSRCNGESP